METDFTWLFYPCKEGELGLAFDTFSWGIVLHVPDLLYLIFFLTYKGEAGHTIMVVRKFEFSSYSIV